MAPSCSAWSWTGTLTMSLRRCATSHRTLVSRRSRSRAGPPLHSDTGGLMKLQSCALAIVLLSATACMDPETTDNRGYTKAPLEHPTVVIRGEEPSDMSEYGTPNRVVAEIIELPPQDS